MATIGARSTGGTGGFPRGLAIGGIVVVIVVMIIAVVAALAALNRGSSSTTDTPSAQAPAVANTGQQTAANSGQTSGGDFKRPAGAVRIGDMLFTVVSVKTLDIKPPEAHLKYVAVELTAQNVGQLTTGNWSIALIDSDKMENFSSLGSTEEARLGQQFGYLVLVDLNPGTQVQGLRIFKVLADTRLVELRVSSANGDSGVIPLK